MFAYWRSGDKWQALALLALGLAITFGATYLGVWANRLVGEVTDSLVNRKWDVLFTALSTSIAVGLASGAIMISNVAVTNLLDLRWRTWLTDHLLTRWTRASAFYDIERDGLLKNADQRIAEDVRLFTDQTLNLFTSLVSVVVSVVTYTVLLWTLSQSVSFELWERPWVVPGYMVYIAYACAIGGLAITHVVGKKLIPLNMQKQGMEADYRYLAMQLRENAEQVAFYGGGEREHRRLAERFAYVKDNFLRIIVRTWKVNFATTAYGHLLDPLATVAALPLYFSGQVTYGGMTRAISAFGSLRSSLSFFSQAYVGFTAWLAVTNRVRDLWAALDAVVTVGQGSLAMRRASQPTITTRELTLRAPHGELLVVVPPLRFAPGERWLVRAPSGTGKSTLLRAVAGIWPHGEGTVTLPVQATMLFLPQRSYIPSGSLEAAVCYPSEPKQFSDSQCRRALELCDLGHLVDALQTVDHWQQKLSGGEQQRLAFARVFLQRPAFVFLDEATSALDPATEQRLYQAVLAELPDSAVISVAHRESLARYHDHVLELSPAPGRAANRHDD